MQDHDDVAYLSETTLADDNLEVEVVLTELRIIHDLCTGDSSGNNACVHA